MNANTMLIATLLFTVATVILTIVNIYIGKRLMDIYRLTKKEGQKVIRINQETNQLLEAIESREKRIKEKASHIGLYDFWPSEN